MQDYDPDKLLDYLEGELPEAEREAMEAQLEAQPSLRRLVEQLEADRAAVRALGEEPAPSTLADDAVGRLERAALLGETPTAGPSGASSSPKRFRVGRVAAMAGAAAIVLLAVGVIVQTLFGPSLPGTESAWWQGDNGAGPGVTARGNGGERGAEPQPESGPATRPRLAWQQDEQAPSSAAITPDAGNQRAGPATDDRVAQADNTPTAAGSRAQPAGELSSDVPSASREPASVDAVDHAPSQSKSNEPDGEPVEARRADAAGANRRVVITRREADAGAAATGPSTEARPAEARLARKQARPGEAGRALRQLPEQTVEPELSLQAGDHERPVGPDGDHPATWQVAGDRDAVEAALKSWAEANPALLTPSPHEGIDEPATPARPATPRTRPTRHAAGESPSLLDEVRQRIAKAEQSPATQPAATTQPGPADDSTRATPGQPAAWLIALPRRDRATLKRHLRARGLRVSADARAAGSTAERASSVAIPSERLSATRRFTGPPAEVGEAALDPGGPTPAVLADPGDEPWQTIRIDVVAPATQPKQ